MTALFEGVTYEHRGDGEQSEHRERIHSNSFAKNFREKIFSSMWLDKTLGKAIVNK